MNNTKRFFYNPDNRKLSLFEASHVEYFHNHKSKFSESFDFYIRGIITEENKILLRVYYPYNDINDLCYYDLLRKSLDLLNLYRADIKKILNQQGIKEDAFILNVTNEDAKDILKACYV